MEASQLDMALQALQTLIEPHRLMILMFGVLLGLAIGVMPGLGGVVALAVLIPFTYNMEPQSAFALAAGRRGGHDDIGLDTGGVVRGARHCRRRGNDHGRSRDGRTRRGGPRVRRRIRRGRTRRRLRRDRARRLGSAVAADHARDRIAGACSRSAFSACRWSRRLSGRAPLKGLTAAGLGLMISMVGAGTQTGTLRWTFDWLYLFDGHSADPGHARSVRAAGTRRPRDQSPEDHREQDGGRERLEPMGGREGRLPELVAVSQMQRHGHASGRDTRHRFGGDRLDRLRLCQAQREGRGSDLRPRRRARRDRAGIARTTRRKAAICCRRSRSAFRRARR